MSMVDAEMGLGLYSWFAFSETIGWDWGARFYVWRYVALLGWVCLLAYLLVCLQHPALMMV